MRVLLTGAAGFVGGAVARTLEAAGHDVLGVDAFIPQAHGPAGHAAEDRVRRLDVRDARSWSSLLRGVDVVCHQAAMVGAGLTVADMPSYAAHNDLGTATLLAAMAQEGVDRLVLASSMVVYGEGRYRCSVHGEQRPGPREVADLDAGAFDHACLHCGQPLDWATVGEETPVDPRGSYAASKVAQEHYAAAWARQAGGASVALRYHNVYGPLMPRDTPYAGVAAIFRSALASGRAPEVFEDGGQMRDFVHVSDVARANLLAVEAVMDRPVGRQRAYNVCSGHPVSILDVARALAGSHGAEPAAGPNAGPNAGLEPVVTGRYRPGDVRHVVASPDRARDELGFSASVLPGEGLRSFAHEPLRDAVTSPSTAGGSPRARSTPG